MHMHYIVICGLSGFTVIKKMVRFSKKEKVIGHRICVIVAFRYFANAPKNVLSVTGFDPQFLGFCNSAANTDFVVTFPPFFLSPSSHLSQWSKHSAMKSLKHFEAVCTRAR